MNDVNHALARLLHQNPNVHAAWTTPHQNPKELHIVTSHPDDAQNLRIETALASLTIIQHQEAPFKILITPATDAPPKQPNQACQNEPIQLGCQIQPARASWVGTAGAPVRWIDTEDEEHFGILSNWHVIASGAETIGRKIYQPTDSYPTMARLSQWDTPDPTRTNRIDAAIADALVEGYHTISPRILAVDRIADHPTDATTGLEVYKSGRTTGLTYGKCTAVGAAVRVSYGHFTAVFEDQDIYQTNKPPFSAPGDSGSAILTHPKGSLTSLLFAGNQTTTIANPIRHIIQEFNLQFPFIP